MAPTAFLCGSLTPYVIFFNLGEDIGEKIMTFIPQQTQAVCILSGVGKVSRVKVHAPTTTTGTVTYVSNFTIVTLSGSFVPNITEGKRSWTGGMSITLSTPTKHIIGGIVAGSIIADGPTQIVLGLFPCESRLKLKNKVG